MSEKIKQLICGRFVVALACLFIWPLIIRWLWKIIIVPITGFTGLTYWQALGLEFLVFFLLSLAIANLEFNVAIIKELIKSNAKL